MRDITLGMYFPGDTIVHRMDPRTKFILVIVFIACALSAKSYISYALVLVTLLLSIAVSRISPMALVRGLKPLVVMIIFTGLINMFYTPGTPIWSFGFLTLTLEGIRNSIFGVLRILMLVSSTFLLTYTTAPIALTDGLESLLNGLRRIKVPVHELAMMMSIALRFIPILIEETDKIMSAQKARGADFDTGKLTQRAKALLPILVPLFLSTFRRADELAIAMESRCYHGGEGRTRMKTLKYRPSDFVAMASGFAVLAGVIVLGRLGL